MININDYNREDVMVSCIAEAIYTLIDCEDSEVLTESIKTNKKYKLDNYLKRFNYQGDKKSGTIEVDGKKLDIPSAEIKPGQVISVRENARNFAVINEALESNIATPAFVDVDKDNKKGTFVRLPERNELNQELNESLIVEYYNR